MSCVKDELCEEEEATEEKPEAAGAELKTKTHTMMWRIKIMK